jgi:outer membrane protein OmpA-like peptidoglycan-associated protein
MDMKRRSLICMVAALLLMAIAATAQTANSSEPVNIFGPKQAEFNQAMKEIMYAWNDHEVPSDEGVLQSNAQWLKDHPDVRFYVNGYASSRGELIYNLVLSKKRAEDVKEELIALGVDASRIRMAVGWGQLYPVCPELNDECWSKNRRVRLDYSPD